MLILAVVNLYPPKSRVGAWLTTHDYLREFAARGHDVHVLQLLSVDPAYTFEGVRVHPRTADYPTPEVVVSHLGDWQEGASYAAKLEVPSVRMGHGFHDDNAVKLDEHPTALAVFSSQALADATGWNGPQMVAHPPIRPADYATIPGDRVTLVNLSPEKGGELFAYIATAMPDVGFLAVKGSWGSRQVTNLPPNVDVVPSVTDAREIYAQTRIVLMPSERETYGRVAVEAACSGIPTIAHPCSGLVEAMGDGATWVDRADLAGWIRTIRELWEPDFWSRASARARSRIASLDPDETCARVCNRIEPLVAVPA